MPEVQASKAAPTQQGSGASPSPDAQQAHAASTQQGLRIPSVPDAQLGPVDVVNAIRKRRGGTLLNLDRMLLNSPAFAVGWNGYLGAVRSSLTLDPRLRELAICAVAVLRSAAINVRPSNDLRSDSTCGSA